MRRIHVPVLSAGEIEVPAAQAHHLRDVLRLEVGTAVEVFDDAGATAEGVLTVVVAGRVMIRIDQICQGRDGTVSLTIAAALPKGNRADWMIEKLSELGVGAFIPLASRRSVVIPEGKNKLERWKRLATESAKQSRRSGMMRIDPVTDLAKLMKAADPARTWHLSPQADARPILDLASEFRVGPVTLLIGPEGGWAEEELAAFESSKIIGVRLADTILRIETAALSAAAILQTIMSGQSDLTCSSKTARIAVKGERS